MHEAEQRVGTEDSLAKQLDAVNNTGTPDRSDRSIQDKQAKLTL